MNRRKSRKSVTPSAAAVPGSLPGTEGGGQDVLPLSSPADAQHDQPARPGDEMPAALPDAPDPEHPVTAETEQAQLSPLDRLSPGERAALIAALAIRMRENRREEEAQLAALDTDPAYAGIAGRAEALRSLQTQFPFLRTLAPRDRLIAAFHIDRSLHPPQPDTEQRLQALLQDAPLLRALSAYRSALLEARNRSVPTMASESGATLPPAYRKPAPRDLREAGHAARNALGIHDKP